MRAIRVKIIKESKEKLTVMMLATNRAMPVKRDDFEERVASGLYEVVGVPEPPAEAEADEPDAGAE